MDHESSFLFYKIQFYNKLKETEHVIKTNWTHTL